MVAVLGTSQSHTAHNLRLPTGLIPLGRRPLVMGILNVTPDSFSDGGQHSDPLSALNQAINMCDQGADIIDVGGESTRPNHDAVGPQQEMDRVLPVILEIIATGVKAPVSIDTSKALVADQAVQAGATIINDVRGLQRDPEIADVAALYDLPLIIMHWDEDRDRSKDIIDEMKKFFDKSLNIAQKAGVKSDQIVLDPGFGFAKNFEENFTLLARLDELHTLGNPLLVGTSRKSMIGKLLNNEPKERVAGTIASNVLAYQKGGHIFRVHDVRENTDALRVATAAIYGAPKGIN